MNTSFARGVTLIALLTQIIVMGDPAFADPPGSSDPADWKTPEFLKDWGLAAMRAEYAYARGITGKGVLIGSVDSGALTYHPDLRDNVRPVTTSGIYAADGWKYSPTNGTYEGGTAFSVPGSYIRGVNDDHGTHVAGIMVADRNGSGMHGVAFGATLLQSNTNGTDAYRYGVNADYNYFKAAYGNLAARGVRAINSSWGNPPVGDNYDSLAGLTDAFLPLTRTKTWLDAAMETRKSGAVMVFAGGNAGADNPSTRAFVPYFRPDLEGGWLAVAAHKQNGQMTEFNQCGMAKWWCITAPGHNINSTAASVDYKNLSGTSMAAPHATGALALVMERFPYMTGEQALYTMLTSADKFGTGAQIQVPDRTAGWGTINLRRAMDGPGQFFGHFTPHIGAGGVDVYANNISDVAIRSREADDKAEQKNLAARSNSARAALVDSALAARASAMATRGLDPLTGETYVGSLEKRGDGTLVLAGRNSYSGSTWVRGGQLVLKGSITSDTTVDGSGIGLSFVNPTTRYQDVGTQGGSFVVETGATAAAVTVRKGGSATIGGRAGKVTAETGGSVVVDGRVGDVTASGGSAVINGQSGDVIASAGGAVEIGGRSGDVTASGGSAIINGRSDTVTATAGGSVLIGGRAGNVTATGGSAVINGQAGDVSASAGGSVLVGGQVGNVAAGGGGTATITGRAGAVTASAGGKATIDGRAGDVAANGGSAIINGVAGNVTASAGGSALIGGQVGAVAADSGAMAVINGRAGDVTIGAAGLLSGSGTLGSLAALSGSVIAPGNSIGTLTVGGPVGFAAGATYRVEIARDGRGDRIATAGAASLSGGLVTVSIENSPALLNLHQAWSVLGRRYTILSAEGGVRGRFDGATPGFVFLNPILDYTGQSVGLTMERSETSFISVGQSGNQRRAGSAVESLGPGNPVFEAVLTLPDAASARTAFRALADETSATVTSSQAATAVFIRETLSGRSRWSSSSGGSGIPAGAGSVGGAYAALDSGDAPQPVAMPLPQPSRYGLWGQGFGTYGRTGATAEVAAGTHHVAGFVVGADGLLDNGLKLGAAAGLAETKLRSAHNGPTADISSPFASLYGGYEIGPVALQFGGVYSDNRTTAKRSVAFPGFFNSLTSKGRSASFVGFGEFGYKVAIDQRLALPGASGTELTLAYVQPYLGLGYTQIRSDRYTERGGPAALTSYANTTDLGDVTLGVKAEARLDLGLGQPMALRGLVGYRRNYGDLTPASLLAFSGGTPFRSSGAPLDRQALVTEAGIDLKLGRNVTMAVTYAGQFGKNSFEHTGKGSLTYRW
ncbi:S8 family serine peptidase [Bosea sp. Leaf344]|uniref:S8 family serine peptidase n=1 Tax=Bosea sp. Leaf344 TaxID=1736346 RepID=UPI0009EB243B|nr:S8 family serine peptidase [Bosea sp. Leaf344]